MEIDRPWLRIMGLAGVFGGLALFAGDMLFYYSSAGTDLNLNMGNATEVMTRPGDVDDHVGTVRHGYDRFQTPGRASPYTLPLPPTSHMRYTTLLFDLDHTLFDFDTSEAVAFSSALATAGIDIGNGYHELFVSINKALWVRVEAGELTPNDVRVVRFADLFEQAGIDADARAVADDYITGLGAHGDLYPGARELLEELSSEAILALASNGIGEVVRDKVVRLDLGRYFDAIVVSGEIGVAKPHTGFFDIAFAQLDHPDKATTLMIGDNLTSDIGGGINYGIDTCWYAPSPAETSVTPTYRVERLSEIPAIARG